jgi:hypothetical protein
MSKKLVPGESEISGNERRYLHSCNFLFFQGCPSKGLDVRVSFEV